MKMVTELPRARPLAAHDQRAVDALLQRSSARQKERYLFGKDGSDLSFYFDGSLGSTHGIFERGELVAMARLRIPSVGHPNRGAPPSRVPAADWPLHTAILENDLVATADRDCGYERALLDARFRRAAAAGMRWACAEVDLRNVVSWRNMLAMGMVITGIRKAGGLSQLELLRPLDGSALRTSPVDSTWAWVVAQDAAGHGNALEAGYLGVRQVFGGTVLYQPSLE